MSVARAFDAASVLGITEEKSATRVSSPGIYGARATDSQKIRAQAFPQHWVQQSPVAVIRWLPQSHGQRPSCVAMFSIPLTPSFTARGTRPQKTLLVRKPFLHRLECFLIGQSGTCQSSWPGAEGNKRAKKTPDFLVSSRIGLAIVRKAVEGTGGRVGVESGGENGSRFWIELAVRQAPSPP